MHTDPLRSRSSKSSAFLLIEPLDRNSSEALFQQIYSHLRAGILTGRLTPETRLPSSRALADSLDVSRTSVVSAYEQLLAEGYLVGRSGSGTYVSADLPRDPVPVLATSPRVRPKDDKDSSDPPVISEAAGHAARFVRSYPQADTQPFARGRCIFDDRSRDAWRKLTRRAVRRMGSVDLGYSDPWGAPELREAICQYLRTARAVHCDPDQILVTAGTQHAIDIALRVLLRPRDAVWIEDPHYSLTHEALRAMGARVCPVPVDAHGLNVAAGIRRAPRAKAVFVTPSHQHPLGVVLSMARRLELLAWARKSGAWIIEDDCDGEFRYAGRPLAALQGLDESGRVIYVGTFNKVLFPGLRMGYVVVPRTLRDAFLGVRFLMDRHPPSLDQAVLADFLRDGHFASHIRRTRLVYRESRDLLVAELRRQLGAHLTVESPDQGMHFAAKVQARISDVTIERLARKEGVIVRALSPLYLEAPAQQGLVFGFTGFAQP